MKEFVNEKSQLENISDFLGNISEDNLEQILSLISFILNYNLETMKNIVLNGKKITDSSIYETHYPIFIDISKKIINRFDLLSVFGFSDDEISEFKKENRDKEKISQMLSNHFGITLDCKKEDIQKKKIEILKNIGGKVTPDVNKKIIERIYYSNDEINRILNGITDYLTMHIKNTSDKDETRREYVSLRLYADAFEIYLKVLKEIYAKFMRIKIYKKNNSKMYDFFEENYPLLLDSTNNKLRNDVCHLTYKVRGDYTIKQIDEERDVILKKAITAIIARNAFLIEFFDKTQVNIDSGKL